MHEVLFDSFWSMNLMRLVIIIGIPWIALIATKDLEISGIQAGLTALFGLGIFYVQLLFADEIDGPELANGQKWLMSYVALSIPISIWLCSWTGWRRKISQAISTDRSEKNED